MSFRFVPMKLLKDFNKIQKSSPPIIENKEETKLALQILAFKLKEHLAETKKLEFFNQSVLTLLHQKNITDEIINKETNVRLLGGSSSFLENFCTQKDLRKIVLNKFKLKQLLEKAKEEKATAPPVVVRSWNKIINLLNVLLVIVIKNKKLILSIGFFSLLLFTIIKNRVFLKLIFIKLFNKLKRKTFKKILQKECHFLEKDGIQEIWLMDNCSDYCPEGSQALEHY